MPKIRDFKSLSEIKKDPDVRVIFPPKEYQIFLEFLRLGKRINVRITPLLKAALLCWYFRWKNADEKGKEEMETEILQRSHGIYQTNLFNEKAAPVMRKPVKSKPKKRQRK